MELAGVEKAASDILGFTKLGYLPWNLIRGFTVFTGKKEGDLSARAHRRYVCGDTC